MYEQCGHFVIIGVKKPQQDRWEFLDFHFTFHEDEILNV